MGATISSVLDNVEGDKEKMANDALNALLELAKMQEEAFMLTVT